MKILSVLGGRPHIIKAESIHEAFREREAAHVLVLARISTFADYPGKYSVDFALPEPIACITASSEQSLSQRLAEQVRSVAPDVVLLYGDLAATRGAFVATAPLGRPIVHIESGYRSGDLLDDEEHTRITVDHGATHRIAYSEAMVDALLAEGVHENSISVFGNPALLTLQRHLSQRIATRESDPYGIVTLHRTENLEHPRRRRYIISQFAEVAERYPLTFILYQRTAEVLSRSGELNELKQIRNLTLVSTNTYAQYLRLLWASRFVITDSSGLQDDSAYLGIPCLVVRRATPRPLAPTARLIGGADGLNWNLFDAVSTALTEVDPDPSPPPAESRPYDDSFLTLLESLLSHRHGLD